MRRVIRKHIRHREDGINVAADVDAVISINTGGGVTHTQARSTHSVVQGNAGKRDHPDKPTPPKSGPPEEER
jgi:hypothetical protein